MPKTKPIPEFIQREQKLVICLLIAAVAAVVAKILVSG